MRINQKVRAFTLMEVTISMLIAAIAIAVTYTAYRIVNGTYLSFKKKQDHVAELALLDRMIKQDFVTADQLNRSINGLDIYSGNGLIKYEFNKKYILRTAVNLPADTFKLVVKSAEFSFETKQLTSNAPIDQLDLRTELEGQDISLFYKKHYSSQSLFK